MLPDRGFFAGLYCLLRLDMNTISYLPNPRYKKYKTDKIYDEAVLSWENTLSWFINYLKNI